MDPDEALRLLRVAVERVWADGDRSSLAEEVAERVEALDDWLSGGGFPPAAWSGRSAP